MKTDIVVVFFFSQLHKLILFYSIVFVTYWEENPTLFASQQLNIESGIESAT